MAAAHWQVLAGAHTAWFGAVSHSAGAALVTATLAAADRLGVTRPDLDLRPDGVQVRLQPQTSAGTALADAVDAAAAQAGLDPDPAAPRLWRVNLHAAEPAAVLTFWREALGYRDDGGWLTDPIRRTPALRVLPDGPAVSARNRLHLDVSRPGTPLTPERAAELGGSFVGGPYGLLYRDAEGNEADLVPTESLGDSAATSDWTVLFAAAAWYPVPASEPAATLVQRAAELADRAELPLRVDVRPEGVAIDSGKDLWEATGFPALAAGVATAAATVGLTARPEPLRFLQLGVDAVEPAAAREFWSTVLGYRLDPRPAVADIVDPRLSGPPIIFQPMDPDQRRLSRPDPFALEVVLPEGAALELLQRVETGGGRVTRPAPATWIVQDPEGIRLTVLAAHDGQPSRASAS